MRAHADLSAEEKQQIQEYTQAMGPTYNKVVSMLATFAALTKQEDPTRRLLHMVGSSVRPSPFPVQYELVCGPNSFP
jgi:hypothetical protein